MPPIDPTARLFVCPTTGWTVQPIETYKPGVPRSRQWKCPACDAYGIHADQPGFNGARPQTHGEELTPFQALRGILPLVVVEVSL